MNHMSNCLTLLSLLVTIAICDTAPAQEALPSSRQPTLSQSANNSQQQPRQTQRQQPRGTQLEFPPRLPDGMSFVTDSSPDFLKPPASLHDDVAIAKTPPTIDFAYFPGQDYEGKPWSAWGDSLATNGKCYASIGDHLAPQGHAYVYEFDPETKLFRQLCDVTKLLALPEGHYTPGKIHTRLDLGSDGWIYFATHRGSSRATNDANHFTGEWIIRCDPVSGNSEIVVHAPILKHCIPTSQLDAANMIFYGSTAPGTDAPSQEIQFFAYDIGKRKLIYAGAEGPSRSLMFAHSTGLAYYTPDLSLQPLMRFDPEVGKPVAIDGQIGIRAASAETPAGKIFTVSQAKGGDNLLYEFDCQSEQVRELGAAAVGDQQYIASLDADPTGRYLYYVPGAHGGGHQDGSPLVQFDTKTNARKVIAFFEPYFSEKYGCTPKGTYSVAVDAEGARVYITWNVSRGSKAWDCCAMAVVHIPASERH
jgi:hypothetical protein